MLEYAPERCTNRFFFHLSKQDFDKFEMILQADEYERDQNIPLDDFFRSTQGKFRTPLVQSWVEELTTQRAARRQTSEQEEPST